MKITDIHFDSNKDAFIFSMDNGKRLQISYQTYLNLGLHIGDRVPLELEEALFWEDQKNRSFQVAFQYASYKRRTCQEVVDKLNKEGITDQELIDQVIEQLKKLYLLDDQAFAKLYIKDKMRLNNWSKKHLSYKMREKGLSQEVIDLSLAQVDDSKEREAMERHFHKRYRRLDLEDEKDFQKAYRGLANRGFSMGPVLAFLNEKRADASNE